MLPTSFFRKSPKCFSLTSQNRTLPWDDVRFQRAEAHRHGHYPASKAFKGGAVEQRKHNQFIEVAFLVLLSFLWGGSFTLIKIAVETVPPATMVTARLAIGAFLLMLLVKVRGIEFPKAPAVWGAFVIQGILQSALPFTLISWAEKHIDSGLAGLLNSTPPLFAFLITYLILHERGDLLRKSIGVATGFAGVVVILGPDVLAGASHSVLGQLAVTGASLSYAIAAIYARRFANQPALLTAASSMVMATMLMLPISLYVDRPWTLVPSAGAIWSVLGLGVFSTGVAMVIYFRLVRTLGTLGVTSGSYLRAGFSVMLGVLLLNEELSFNLAVGLALIFLGVAIVTGQIKWPTSRTKAA
jgi:drug/metabolite transporter (DMT)-like permease